MRSQPGPAFSRGDAAMIHGRSVRALGHAPRSAMARRIVMVHRVVMVRRDDMVVREGGSGVLESVPEGGS